MAEAVASRSRGGVKFWSSATFDAPRGGSGPVQGRAGRRRLRAGKYNHRMMPARRWWTSLHSKLIAGVLGVKRSARGEPRETLGNQAHEGHGDPEDAKRPAGDVGPRPLPAPQPAPP